VRENEENGTSGIGIGIGGGCVAEAEDAM